MPGNEVARRGKGDVSRPQLEAALEQVVTLQVEDVAQRSTDDLVNLGAAYAREYLRIVHKQTVLAQNIAVVLVALRVHFQDMNGRTADYRKAVANLYSAAGAVSEADKDELSRLQSTARYHVGNVLRRHLTPRELEALDLKLSSPKERQADQRKANAALVVASRVLEPPKALTSAKKTVKSTVIALDEQPPPPPSPVKATADHLRLAHAVVNIVDQMSPDVITNHMTAGQRAKLDQELADLEAKIAELRQHTKKRRSRAK